MLTRCVPVSTCQGNLTKETNFTYFKISKTVFYMKTVWCLQNVFLIETSRQCTFLTCNMFFISPPIFLEDNSLLWKWGHP